MLEVLSVRVCVCVCVCVCVSSLRELWDRCSMMFKWGCVLFFETFSLKPEICKRQGSGGGRF